MNYAQHLDEDGVHFGARVGSPGVAAAPVVVREFHAKSGTAATVYEGPMNREVISAMGHSRGSSLMVDEKPEPKAEG